jgi:hypothetical protein
VAACPIAFSVDEKVAAARYTGMLVDLSRQHVLPHLAAFGARFEQVLIVKAGGLGGGSPRRSGGQAERVDPNFSFRSWTPLMPLAEALGQVGLIAEGLALLEAGIEQFEAGCFTPEVVRLKKDELSQQRGTPGAEGPAEIHFRQALDGAREHGALSWELRAAMSLACLLRHQGRAPPMPPHASSRSTTGLPRVSALRIWSRRKSSWMNWAVMDTAKPPCHGRKLGAVFRMTAQDGQLPSDPEHAKVRSHL